jgi:hypothetical protein
MEAGQNNGEREAPAAAPSFAVDFQLSHNGKSVKSGGSTGIRLTSPAFAVTLDASSMSIHSAGLGRHITAAEVRAASAATAWSRQSCPHGTQNGTGQLSTGRYGTGSLGARLPKSRREVHFLVCNGTGQEGGKRISRPPRGEVRHRTITRRPCLPAAVNGGVGPSPGYCL